ncbi:hypothetical protein ABGT15_06550 [Flavobacterium enshiense]|uniref:hypothetical protein n=1 Tax=Flavobacterium enshiense TaxID=1341165 RepID=UPI00345D763C
MYLKIILFFFAVSCLSCNKHDTKVTEVHEKTTDSKKDQKEKIEQIIKKYSGTKYDLTQQKECDLNNDGLTDVILIFANKEDVLSGFPETYIAPIVVLLSSTSNYIEFCNYNIYPNNFGDYFKQLVVKENYFTIELGNEVPDEYEEKKYVTFKCENYKVRLHRYGSIINWDEDNTKTERSITKADFGTIEFEKYSSNTIHEFMPKK